MNNVSKIFTLSIAFFLAMGMFQSCVKERIEESITEINPQAQELITTSVYGKVLNESGQALAGANVYMDVRGGEINTRTDRDGNFEFISFQNPGSSAFFRIEAPGYFDGFRRTSVIRNNYNYTQVKLLEKTTVGSISSTTGGEARTAEGMTLALPAGAVSRQNGEAYNGTVQVAMAWIDPSASDLPDMIVGDLTGRNLRGEEVSLSSFGMVNVELLADDGQELKIVEGKTAELTFPVPASRLVKAPPTIPLWSYDEINGQWVEESFATLEGNRYVGKVEHFSAWNVDFMSDPISINGCINFTSSQTILPISMRAKVLVCSDLIGRKGGWVCPDGKFLFYNFPKNEEFTLKILDECGNVVFEETYGPFTTDQNLGIIDVTVTVDLASITGTALDCNSIPITNGYVKATSDLGFVYIVPIVDGVYQLDIPVCSQATSIEFVAVDIENILMSDAVQIALTPGALTVPPLFACTELPEFLSVNLDGIDECLFNFI